MSWDSAVTRLEAIMTAAGTAVGGGYTIQAGEPGAPPKKTGAWWYDGLGQNPLIPETLTDAPWGDLVTVRWYWPVSTRAAGPSRTVEMEMRSVANAFYDGLQGDRDLNGNVESLTVGDFNAGWLSIDNGWWRTLTCPLTLGFTDAIDIVE